MTPTLIAHGGAWDWDDAQDGIKCSGLKEAVFRGYQVLQQGGTALDAVEQTVIALEDNPVFDAGTGGYLNQAGVVQLDALIVDGSKYDFGAVGGATRVRNPITLARKVMESTEQCFLVGEGADLMAEKLGISPIPNIELVTPEMRTFFASQQTEGPSDTVGAVALDHKGNVAVATSTSGTPYKPVGRVGDSPIYGAGGYAENGVGTTGTTGKGENIMRTLLAKYTNDQMATGLNAQAAAKAAMQHIEAIFQNSMSGVIVIDQQGNLGAAHTSPKLALGWVDHEGNIFSAVTADALHDRS